jgi:hypothetical protein
MIIWELAASTAFTNFVFSSESDKVFFHELIKSHFDEARAIDSNWRFLCMQRNEPMKHPDLF